MKAACDNILECPCCHEDVIERIEAELKEARKQGLLEAAEIVDELNVANLAHPFPPTAIYAAAAIRRKAETL